MLLRTTCISQQLVLLILLFIFIFEFTQFTYFTSTEDKIISKWDWMIIYEIIFKNIKNVWIFTLFICFIKPKWEFKKENQTIAHVSVLICDCQLDSDWVGSVKMIQI